MINSTKVVKGEKNNSNNLDNGKHITNKIKNGIENEIDIHKLIDDLQNIGDEKNKEDFIKNYSKIKEQIKIVDNMLFNNGENNKYNESNESEETEESEESDKNNESIKNDNLKSKTINELLSVLEYNEDKIFNYSNLNIGELKSLMEICDILEKKINDETINIIEIK